MLKQVIDSFKYAFHGLTILIKEEHNYIVHLAAATLAVVLGFIYKISSIEWCLVIFAVSFVMVTETLNTSIENIMDFVSPDRNSSVKRIKDLSAAAVFMSAISALIVGIIIFLPKMLGV